MQHYTDGNPSFSPVTVPWMTAPFFSSTVTVSLLSFCRKRTSFTISDTVLRLPVFSSQALTLAALKRSGSQCASRSTKLLLPTQSDVWYRSGGKGRLVKA